MPCVVICCDNHCLLLADTLVLVEGTGQTQLASNYGDGFATSPAVLVRCKHTKLSRIYCVQR